MHTRRSWIHLSLLFLVLASRKGATASLCPFVATSWQRSPDLGRAMAWSPQLLRRARPGAGGGVAPRPRPPHEQVRGPLHFDMAAESDEDLEFDAPKASFFHSNFFRLEINFFT